MQNASVLPSPTYSNSSCIPPHAALLSFLFSKCNFYFYPIVTWPDCPLAQNAFTLISHQLKFSPHFSCVAEMPRSPQRLYYPLFSFHSSASLLLENFSWDIWKHSVHFASGKVFTCLFYSVNVNYLRAEQEELLICFLLHTHLTCGWHAKKKKSGEHTNM